MRYARLGPSSVLVRVLINALEITVEERLFALEMCIHGQDDRSENTAQKRLIFTSKWTAAWHDGMVRALLNTNFQSFHSPIAMEEQRPSLETPTGHTADRPEFSRRSS